MSGENAIELLRLFVAIPVPEVIRQEIVIVQEEMLSLVASGVVRWTKAEQIHLTLKFLGNVSVERIDDLKSSVQKVCANHFPVPLRAEGLGFFPNAYSPRVIWVGITDQDKRLQDLQKSIERAVDQFAARPKVEQFVGHLTLGRFGNPRSSKSEKLMRRSLTMSSRLFGEWTAHEIQIMRSESLPSGARHTLLANFRLRKIESS